MSTGIFCVNIGAGPAVGVETFIANFMVAPQMFGGSGTTASLIVCAWPDSTILFRIRYGGTWDAADGTLAGEATVAGGSLGYGTGTLIKPTALTYFKLTGEKLSGVGNGLELITVSAE